MLDEVEIVESSVFSNGVDEIRSAGSISSGNILGVNTCYLLLLIKKKEKEDFLPLDCFIKSKFHFRISKRFIQKIFIISQ